MTPRKHLDEAREAALEVAVGLVRDPIAARYLTVVVDIYGRISVVAWTDEGSPVDLARPFADACGEHWTGTVHVSHEASPAEDSDVLARTAWKEGTSLDAGGRVRVTDRFRHHTSWRAVPAGARPLWSLDAGPPIIVFHGFKGGVGRTTLLASYALACTRRGEHVAVVDVDLDAPGIGALLVPDAEGASAARWGTVDYLLESLAPFPTSDYLHVVAREGLTGEGRIDVMPAGRLNDSYLPKLARIDLEVHGAIENHPLGKLLFALRERTPKRIFLDGRAGLSPAAGLLLSGFAHLHVLIGTSNPQSLSGLERVVRHLGYESARQGLPQLECLVVQALVPEVTDAAKVARSAFAGRVEEIFRDGYYAQAPAEDDSIWSVEDMSSSFAPHVPVPISYRAKLAHFSTIDDVADILTSDAEFAALHARIDEQVGQSEPETEDG